MKYSVSWMVQCQPARSESWISWAQFLMSSLSCLLSKGVTQSPPHTLDVWDHTLVTVQELGKVLNVLKREYDPETAANWALGLVSLRLGRFRRQLSDHLGLQLNPERSLTSLVYLAALFHDVSKPQTAGR